MGVEELGVIDPLNFPFGVHVRRHDSDRVPGAPAMRNSQKRVRFDTQASGPGATHALDDGARIDQHPVQVKEKRRTMDLHSTLNLVQ